MRGVRLVLHRRKCFGGTRHLSLYLSSKALIAYSAYSLTYGKSRIIVPSYGPKVLCFKKPVSSFFLFPFFWVMNSASPDLKTMKSSILTMFFYSATFHILQRHIDMRSLSLLFQMHT